MLIIISETPAELVEKRIAVVEGTDEVSEGVWMYSNSQVPLPEPFWSDDEPNNNLGNEDCLAIVAGLDGMGDITCESWCDVALCEVYVV